MEAVKSLYHFAYNIGILIKKRPDKHIGRLVRTYLKLEILNLVSSLFSIPIRRAMVLGFTVYAPSVHMLLYLFEEIFIKREYAFDTSAPAPLIIDCGSNIGMSVLFFKYLYPKARIIAFEPARESFSWLRKNVEANHLKGVTLHNAAVYDKDTTLTFHFDPSEPSSLANSLDEARIGPNSYKVKAMRLARFVHGPVDFLKMDIEGAEDVVLADLDASGKLHQIDQMAVEYHHHIDPTKNDLGVVFGMIERNGFRYQLTSPLRSPFRKDVFQDILIYAY